MTRKSFNTLSAPILADPERRGRVREHERAMRDALQLGQLREARNRTQAELVGALEVSQANISRIERQEDLYLSTLSGYVEDLGGHIEVNAVFPDTIVALGTGNAKKPRANGEETRPRRRRSTV